MYCDGQQCPYYFCIVFKR
uniref:Uncharacterized protein n=1 Tax=Anguilla anguilla TaxID=7936 RepID=A0A0E9PFR5_ANGAN